MVDGDGVAEALDHIDEPDVDRRHVRLALLGRAMMRLDALGPADASADRSREVPRGSARCGRGYGRERAEGVKDRNGARIDSR